MKLDAASLTWKSLGSTQVVGGVTPGKGGGKHPDAKLADVPIFDTVAEAKAGLSAVRSALRQRDIDGRTYFFVKPASGSPPSSPRIDLIQGYDEYVMSYGESKDVLRASVRPASRAVNRNVYLHAVLLDGQLIGHWKSMLKANDVTVSAALYRDLSKAETVAMDVATFTEAAWSAALRLPTARRAMLTAFLTK